MGLIGVRKAIHLYKPSSSSGGYTFTNAEAETYVNAMGTEPDDTRKEAIDDFFTTLKAGVSLASFDAIYLLAAHNSADALINAVNPGTYNCTVVGSPTFTTDRGYESTGTDHYLNTGFNASTAGGAFLQDSAHISAWVLTDAASFAGIMGCRGTSSLKVSHFTPRTSGNVAQYGLNQDAALISSSTNNVGTGHYVLRRSGASALAIFKDAASLGTSTQASTTRTNANIYICGYNNNGGHVTRAGQVMAASYGASLSDAEITAYYNALNAYKTAVGA